MAKSLITAVLSALRWAHWLVKCAVVYPLAMMMLLVVLVFRTGPYTFGQMLVKTVESVQQEGYVIQDCAGPASRGELDGDAVNAPLPPVLQEDCSTVSTDAAGYAAYIDQSYTHNILWLWLLMAVVFTRIAVVFRRTPVRRGIIRKNGVVVGESVLGSSGLILARSDVSQIKRVYDEMSPGEGDKFVRAIKENTQIRMNLKK